LLRGDSAARSEYYNKIFQIGGMIPNEIRSKENMNPVEGGDQNFVMLNMVPLDKAEEMQTAPEPEPEPDKNEIKAYFKYNSEKRSITARDRIARQYEPLILDAATAIVSREVRAIKGNIKKPAAIDNFIADFYRNFPEYINKKMSPVIRSYMLAIIDSANSELGLSDADFETEVREYLDRYIERHIESSEGQMLALADDPEKIEQRADEWIEKRPEKIASDEKVRASGAAYTFVVFAAGLSLTWKIRGSKTCPYCTSLNGKKVRSGQYFANSGDEIDPEGGNGPMKINGLKQHPPLHQGCDCYVSGG